MSKLLDIAQFVENVAHLIQDIVDSTHQSTSNSLQVVTAELTKIQAETNKQAGEATDKLDHLYFEPSESEHQELNQVQHEVDVIVDSALEDRPIAEAGEISQLGSEFSKTVEAVNILNDHFTKTLFQLMGTLSSEDVIHLRLNNLSKCCQHIIDLVQLCESPHTQEEIHQEFFDVEDDVLHLFSSSGEARIIAKANFKAPRMDPIKPEHVLRFFADFLNILSEFIDDVRKLFLSAIETTNDSVFKMADVATESIKHAQYKVRRQAEGDDFQNVVVESDHEPLTAIKEVSSVVSDGVFSLMRVLSEGDVCNQRLEVAAKIAEETAKCLHDINVDFNTEVQLQTAKDLFHGFFVSEDDKRLFNNYFGNDVKKAS